MPIDIIDTTTNHIEILDDGTAIDDILFALDYVRRERARHRAKNAKRVRPSTGRPRGRPKKVSPVAENQPE